MNFSKIAIIYNPNSTGPSRKIATDLKQQLDKKFPAKTIRIYPTKYAGHGEKIAYDVAKSSKRPLIISSSGDGGYNEVINGAMRAQDEGAHPTVGLLPGGNANDHYNNLHERDTMTRILSGKGTKVDVLHLKGGSIDRYAHSYIGLGLTPWAGKMLTETKLNHINQIGIVLKALFTVRPTKIRTAKGIASYSSVVFSNVDVMAKVLRVSQDSKINDGKFEITSFKESSRLKLIAHLFKASTTGVKEDKKVRHYSFETIRKTLIQLDGEVYPINAKTKVAIEAEHQALETIV